MDGMLSDDVTTRGGAGRGDRRRPLRLSWEATDGCADLTRIAAVGVVAAAFLALWGLPPVDLHGPLHRWGIMDLLCGGTRSAYFAVHGYWAQAWRYNPLGPIALTGAGVMALRAVVAVATGRWLTVHVTVTPRRARLAIIAGAAVALALALRQQLMAGILR